MKIFFIGASCKSHLLRHSGESRNPELLGKTGFRVALRLPGMTTFSCFQEFCKKLIGLSFLMCLLYPLPASAAAPLDTVQKEITKVLDVVRDPNLNAEVKKEKLRAFYGQMFDEGEFSRRTLGANWSKLNSAQQPEFIQLFREVLEKAYIHKILAYTNEKIVFAKESLLGNNLAEVQTKVITSSQEIPITYRVILKDGTWKVYDVVVENVSLIQNYRSQFNAILAKSGPEEMLEILRKKVKEK